MLILKLKTAFLFLHQIIQDVIYVKKDFIQQMITKNVNHVHLTVEDVVIQTHVSCVKMAIMEVSVNQMKTINKKN